MILSHARLPIPTLPQKTTLDTNSTPERVSHWLTLERLTPELLSSFLSSRRDGISKHTIIFYHNCLKRFIGYPLTPDGINEFIHSLDCGNAKHSYYRAIRALCNWLYRQDYLKENPIRLVDSPSVTKRLLPSITEQQKGILLEATETLRDTCIVSLLFDSRLRLSEIYSIQSSNIDWNTNTLRVVVKGNREPKAVFTPNATTFLREYLTRNGHSSDSSLGMKPRGVQNMLSRLSREVDFPCNAHSFRRGFTCNLHKIGLSTLSIMHLGRWSSLDMVSRYCRSITFDDCLEQYRQANNS